VPAGGAPEARPERLLGRIWTHAEVMQRVELRMEREAEKPETAPAHWPSGVRLDSARWVYWLPQGWGQGIKVTSGGKDLKCYVDPEGKLFYHKVDIEKALGEPLAKRDPLEETREEPADNLDAAPQRWPDRLPADWRLSMRRLPGGTCHKVYIAPAAETREDFFFWHMKDVEAYLAGSKAKGTPLHGFKNPKYESVPQKKQQGSEQPATPPAKRRRQGAAESGSAVEALAEDPPVGPPSTSKQPKEVTTLASMWSGRTSATSSKTSAEVFLAAAAGQVVEVSDSEQEDAPPPAPPASALQRSLAAAPALDVEDEPQPAPPAAALIGTVSAVREEEQPKQPRRVGAAKRASPWSGAAAPSAVEGAAAAAGMSPASLEEFFQFLQCQICMEAREVLGKQLEPEDPAVRTLWPDYEAFVTPNLGATERWVPYHTALGVHEFYLIESVHHRKEPLWDAKRRFMAIFIFRAHCKRDFFNQAQLPYLLCEDFWRDPVQAFEPEGALERSMREYRRRTRQPLLTLAMRMIPERLLEDDDDNLVRSIVLRTQRLLEVAEQIWPVIQDANTPAGKRFAEISQLVQKANGLGETWAKMLCVCLDLAYPNLGLLASQCDVGIGAQAPLRCLLPEGRAEEPREALRQLQRAINSSQAPSSKHFWILLPKVEELVRQRFSGLPLILDQVRTERGKMSAVTLQVQLCEYRQFRNSLARTRFGLPGDDSMKLPEKPKRARPEDQLEFDKAGQRILLSIPSQEGQQHQQPAEQPLEVPLAAAGGRRRLAERVALLCLEKLRDGASRAEVVTFREELCRHCKGSLEDVHDDSEAWTRCRVTLKHINPLVGFTFQAEGGPKISFQTTVKAAGSIMNAERIARLCWARFDAGDAKEVVLAYRAELYRRGTENLGSLWR